MWKSTLKKIAEKEILLILDGIPKISGIFFSASKLGK